MRWQRQHVSVVGARHGPAGGQADPARQRRRRGCAWADDLRTVLRQLAQRARPLVHCGGDHRCRSDCPGSEPEAEIAGQLNRARLGSCIWRSALQASSAWQELAPKFFPRQAVEIDLSAIERVGLAADHPYFRQHAIRRQIPDVGDRRDVGNSQLHEAVVQRRGGRFGGVTVTPKTRPEPVSQFDFRLDTDGRGVLPGQDLEAPPVRPSRRWT